MNKNFYIVSVMAVALMSGCGGGGGDGRDATGVGGTWRGALTKVSDACSTQSPSTINVTHQVSQNEDAVTLVAESGVQFLGNTVGENGFSVNASHSTVGSSSCTDQTQIAYDSINSDTDPTADVDIQINRTCPGASTCRIEFTGTVSRTVTATPTNTPGTNTPAPTATPGGTVTPTTTTGGCNDMNTRPANETYSGDGGCGISDAGLGLQGGNVVLNPFGANGATSFTISSSNSSSASSQNTNLTIQGTAGYSCSMVCSPPATFTVQCFKEGGTTCVEKF